MAENEAIPAEIIKASDPEPQITPMAMLALAVKQKADIDKIGKLMDLQERWEKREAEKAFVAALAAFKKNPPEIIKNKKVSYELKTGGKTEYRHSTLDRVTSSIGAALGEHGLSARWRTHQEGARIKVTCILQHEKGHAEETTLEASPDDSGSKNPVQAIASTVTYLERYTLLAATGMATRDDSDGITFGDAEDMVNSIMAATTMDELQDRFNKVYKRAYAAKDKAAMGIAIETKEQRKAELTGKVVPKSNIPPASAGDAEQQRRIDEFHQLADAAGLNKANKHMMLGELGLDAALDKVKTLAKTPDPKQEAEAPKPGKKGRPAPAVKAAAPEQAEPSPQAPANQPEFGF